jgi:1-acyl-sn-glycerol-3-phosphate acyltransferase
MRTNIISFWMLATARFRLRVTDHNPSPADHSRLYIAPHVCMLESIILIRVVGHIRTIASEFTRTLPLFGKVVEASDPIFVKRARAGEPNVVELMAESLDTTASRHSVFPEGTFSNGRSLLRFKNGGFMLGRPITPVIFRYPSYVPFWSRDESTFLVQIYRMVSRLYTPIDVIIFPTWHPTEAEADNPKLFADNVRRFMAWHLGVPLSKQSQRNSPNFRRDLEKLRALKARAREQTAKEAATPG